MRILFLGKKRDYFLHYNFKQNPQWIEGAIWYITHFIEEVKRQCDVIHCEPDIVKGCIDYPFDIPKNGIIKDLEFDIILINGMYSENLYRINEIKNIPKVILSGDLYQGAYRYSKMRRRLRYYNFDLLFGYSSLVTFWAEQWGCAKSFDILPFSVDINIYQKWDIPKRFDVMASFSTLRQGYAQKRRGGPLLQIRKQIQELVQKMLLTSWTKGSWYIDNVLKINQSKICLNYLHQGFFNPRYFEVLACGGFLLTNQPIYDLERIGLEAGKHFATFKGLNDLEEKIEYWLTHDKERERIARQGMRFVRRYHNTKVRVKEFIQKVEKFLSKRLL